MNIQEILKPWTPAFMEAAQREGWDLFTTSDDAGNDIVQVQRIDDPEDLPSGIATYLPSDDVAMMVARTGTGVHHSAARKIIHDHFPTEWALMDKAAGLVGSADASVGMTPKQQAVITELRDAGYLVVIWAPDELGDADIGNMEDVVIQRGNEFIGD